MPVSDNVPALLRAPVAAILGWIVPGLGHVFLGHKTRGIIFLVTITLTFWTGVAIGGMKTVHPKRPPIEPARNTPQTRSWWFYGQMMVGSYAVLAWVGGKNIDDFSESGAPRYLSWPSGDVASVYTGVAGLLNLLIILDVFARSEGLTSAGAAARGRNRAGPATGRT